MLLDKYFSVALIFSCIIGLFLPGLEKIPSPFIAVLLSLIIYLSCFHINISEFYKLKISSILIFYILRFLLLPILLFYCAGLIVPSDSIALFLFSLMPAGISSSAFVTIFNGNVVLSFALLIVSTLLTPFVTPLLLKQFTHSVIEIKTIDVFFTLSLTIFIPIIVFMLTRNVKLLKSVLLEKGKSISIVVTLFLTTVVIGQQRLAILENPMSMLGQLFLSSMTYLIFYIFGWIVSPGKTLKERITFSISSGANNNALGLSISTLYFPQSVSIFLVLSAIPWTLSFIPFKWFVDFMKNKYND